MRGKCRCGEVESLHYEALGGQKKATFIELLEALTETVKKDKGMFYRFKIKVEGKP